MNFVEALVSMEVYCRVGVCLAYSSDLNMDN